MSVSGKLRPVPAPRLGRTLLTPTLTPRLHATLLQRQQGRRHGGLTQMSCFSPMGKCEYRSTASGVRYVGVVFLVICREPADVRRTSPARCLHCEPTPTLPDTRFHRTAFQEGGMLLAPTPTAAHLHSCSSPPVSPGARRWLEQPGRCTRDDACAVFTQQEARPQWPRASCERRALVRAKGSGLFYKLQ